MKISDLKAGASNVNIEATVTEKQEPREVVTKYGKRLNVANVTLKDETGSILLTVWGNDIDTIEVGDKVRITNGYVSEFRGTPQLSAGKYGKIEVIEKGSNKEEELKTSEEFDKEDGAEDTNDIDEFGEGGEGGEEENA
ncbi:MAG: OB-fold nucleic acid binding domain-containing protein [Candidatus Micrarchaeota archaeon]